MKNIQKYRGAILPMLSGATVAVLAFSLPLMQTLITFGQLDRTVVANILNIILTVLMGIISLIADKHFFNKSEFKSVYAVSFYSVCLLLVALFFYFITNFDIHNLYNDRADEAIRVFKAMGFVFCGINLLFLIFRIGFDFYRQFKNNTK